MSRTEERRRRELEVLTERSKIQHLAKNYLSKKSMFLKGTEPPAEARILDVDLNNNMNVQISGAELETEQTIVLFRILGRYIELKAVVLEVFEKGTYKCQVIEAAIAKKERKAMRIPVRAAEVHINNIRTSKNKIDATLFNIPTSVKVSFSSYEQTLKSRFDVVKIDVYGKRGTIVDEVRKTGKCLFVSDTQAKAAYEPIAMHVLDYAEFLGDGLLDKMREYKQEKVVSEVIVPVNYLTHDESIIPLGYIQVQSHERHFSGDTIMELQQMAFEMVDRIRDSNTVLVQEQQTVINFSRGGLKLLIDHPDLKDYLIRQNGFTFDMFFKGQAPITLYGLIRSTHLAEDGKLTIGLMIHGSSARQGEMKRFLDNLGVHERRLKEMLAKRKAMLGNN